ncbi:hypothetical protein [Bacillus sp. AK031]
MLKHTHYDDIPFYQVKTVLLMNAFFCTLCAAACSQMIGLKFFTVILVY